MTLDYKRRVFGDEFIFFVEQLVGLVIGHGQVEVGDPAKLFRSDDRPLEVADGDVEPVGGQRHELKIVLELESHGHRERDGACDAGFKLPNS